MGKVVKLDITAYPRLCDNEMFYITIMHQTQLIITIIARSLIMSINLSMHCLLHNYTYFSQNKTMRINAKKSAKFNTLTWCVSILELATCGLSESL